MAGLPRSGEAILGLIVLLGLAWAGGYLLGYRHGHHAGASLDHPWRHGREA